MSTLRLLRLADVKLKAGLSRSAIYAKEAAGLFPNRVCLGGRSVAWVEDEVDAWIAQRIAASRSGQPQAMCKQLKDGKPLEKATAEHTVRTGGRHEQ